MVIADNHVAAERLTAAVSKAGYRAIVQKKRLLENRRQVPPSESTDYDLLIVGGGSAAFAAAIKAAELGARVAIVEQGTIGGTCVNIGCVPSKTLIKAAEICYHSAYSEFEGMTACPPPSDWQQVVQQKDDLVAALREEKYVKVLRAHANITLIEGRAQLTGERGVLVSGTAYTPDKILVATGSSPWTPPIPGLRDTGFLDSTDALSLKVLPKTMIVVGGGTIGLELGQLFTRFGVQVTLVETFSYIAAAEEPEVSEALEGYLTNERMNIVTGAKIDKVSRSGDEVNMVVEANGTQQTHSAEQLLVTTGRRANTDGFGLIGAGVKLGPRGEIQVDAHLRTTNPNVFAAGDCIGNPMFVYVAAYAGQLAAENALTGTGNLHDLSALPRVTFTDPQLASVGMTEAQARDRGLGIETAILSFSKDVTQLSCCAT